MKVEIILTIALLLCTAAYTIINYFMLKESIEARRQKNSPLIIAYLELSESHRSLNLIIKNIGEGIAKNVRVKMLNEFNRFGRADLPLEDVGIFKNGLSIFPPQSLLCYPIHFLSDLENIANTIIEIEIVCDTQYKLVIKERYSLVINQILGQGYNNPPDSYIGQIPYFLNEIKNILKAKT